MQLTQRFITFNGAERVLTALPAVAGAVFGLSPLLISTTFASVSGFSGDDPYIYWLAGAATLGYFFSLTLGLIQNEWLTVRWPIVATLVFNIASLYACAVAIGGGARQIIVYLITGASLLFVAITGSLLYRHRAAVSSPPDVAPWAVGLTAIATLLATLFGLLPLLIPDTFGRLFGYKVTDVFIYRQAGAATLGYAVMGLFELRSRVWREMRLPAIMAAVFNGVGCLASLVAIAMGDRSVLPVLIAPVSFAVTAALVIAIRRQGK
jgi:hypothetical protein